MSGIHLTRIYTRVGDDGTSALGDFSRVSKTHPRLIAYADTDETNATIGAVLALAEDDDLDTAARSCLKRIQNELFDVGADLCVPMTDETNNRLRIGQDYIDRLESDCDTFNERLQPLTSFVLPGGSKAAALLHVSRTVARRAERSTWALIESEPDTTNVLNGHYLNRLSDFLFILGRVANNNGVSDITWSPGASADKLNGT